MNPRDALIELLGRVAASQGPVILTNDDELSQWPSVAVAAMKTQRLLSKARPATSAICPGCERDCVMPVHVLPAKGNGHARAFIVCDKRDDINRVAIPLTRLIQWKCSAEAVCGFVAASLALRRTDKPTASAKLWEVGIVTGNKRSQMLCLQTDSELIVTAGNSQIPLAELIVYQEGSYSLDSRIIRQLVDASTTADKRYTPSNTKREAGKLNTQSMYITWQKEYRKLKKNNPNKSDIWYSIQLAKLEIAKGRDSETIRKSMKS